jgi:uncharacterized protein involved in outer membrane biogenesis
MSRPFRIILITVAALLVLVAGAGAFLLSRFDPNAYKPQIIAAVRHATGRDLTLNGRISLKPSLWPTIQVADAAFSNPPGFSRPQMATLQGLQLQLALLPLLSSRFEIDRLVLIHPDILLETDGAGRMNWQLSPEVSPSAPAGTQEPVKSGRTTTAVSIESIDIQDGTLAYRDGATGKVTTLGLSRFAATAASPDAPVHVDADASYNGNTFSLTADTGSLSRLQDPAATSPWPVKLALTGMGTKLTADGALTQPMQGKGYNLDITAAVPDTASLAPLLQGRSVPPVHDIRLAARIADTGGKIPAFSTLAVHAGASDLGAQVPGLTLDRLDIAAAAVDQPLKIEAAGRLDSQPLAFAATMGPLARLMPGARPEPFPVDVTLQAAGATVSAKGTIADVRALTGANVALSAQIPDLSSLSQLARRPLPGLKQVAFQGTLTDVPSGLADGVILHSFALTSAVGDLSGDIAASRSPKDAVAAVLQSNRIDLDALQAAVDQMTARPTGASPSAQPPAASQSPKSQPSAPPASAPQASAPQSPAPSRRGERLFSDRPLPFGLLRTADADLKLNVATLRTGGADYKAIATHAVLKDGKLSVNPFTANLPEGHLSGTLSADAIQAAPPVHITLHAPGLALQSILAAANEPSFANGNLEVYADLRGAGESPHAIAGSLDGYLGLAMARGTIDNRLLGSLLGKVLDSLNALNLVGKGGTSELKCFGARMDAHHGIGSIGALTLSSSLLTMTGAGAINLGDETLAMQLRPQARVAGAAVVIPVDITGGVRNPAVKVNEIGTAESNAGTVAGAVLGNATPLGIVGGLLGANKALTGGTADICTPALAMARGQPVPEATPPAPAPQSKETAPAKPGPEAILKNLFR